MNEGIRKAGNHPEQASAQGTIKIAMARILPLCRKFGEKVVKPLLQIHDELIFQVIKSFSIEFAETGTTRDGGGNPVDYPRPVEFGHCRKMGRLQMMTCNKLPPDNSKLSERPYTIIRVLHRPELPFNGCTWFFDISGPGWPIGQMYAGTSEKCGHDFVGGLNMAYKWGYRQDSTIKQEQ